MAKANGNGNTNTNGNTNGNTGGGGYTLTPAMVAALNTHIKTLTPALAATRKALSYNTGMLHVPVNLFKGLCPMAAAIQAALRNVYGQQVTLAPHTQKGGVVRWYGVQGTPIKSLSVRGTSAGVAVTYKSKTFVNGLTTAAGVVAAIQAAVKGNPAMLKVKKAVKAPKAATTTKAATAK